VTSMLFSVIAGRGSMAQFSHPEFGGSGQWMAGGAIMISDMFNNALKARVDALCNELSALLGDEPAFAADSFQSQSQGVSGNLQPGSSSLMVSEGPDRATWWPTDLGVPSSFGAQNEVRYAYFPATRRLAISTEKLPFTTHRTIKLMGSRSNSPDQARSISPASSAALMLAACLSSLARAERRHRPNQRVRRPQSNRPRPVELLQDMRTYSLR
jgi:hypothetical protein